MAVIDKIDYSATRSQSLGDANNPRYHSVEWRAQRDPSYHVYVYNISARNFVDPVTGRGMIGRINMAAPGVTDDDTTLVTVERKEKGKSVYTEEEGDIKWHFVTSFPQPVLVSKFDDAAETIQYVETDAVRFIIDQIWPDNPTRSLDTKLPDDPKLPQSSGNNYSQRGVFFSLANPPLKSDVDAARKRLEAYYKYLLDRAAALEHSDEKQLSEELRSNPDYGYAANYFGRAFKWNQRMVRTVECTNCGEQKPQNRLFHMASFGLCVERSAEAWRSAVETGAKTYESVPAEFKWRKEEK